MLFSYLFIGDMMKILYYLIIGLLLITFVKTDNNTINNKHVSLFGVNIVIDPGHGGKDNGTCYEGVLEDEINLSIATKLMNICIEDGAVASLTRVNDYDLSSDIATNRKKEDLKKRVEYINNSGADYFISLHLNSYPSNTNVHGPMVYYAKNNETSKEIAMEIAGYLNKMSGVDKPIHAEDFYLFRKSNVPGVLIECGFLSNEKERTLLLKEDYQHKIAKTIYEGMDNYLLGKKI